MKREVGKWPDGVEEAIIGAVIADWYASGNAWVLVQAVAAPLSGPKTLESIAILMAAVPSIAGNNTSMDKAYYESQLVLALLNNPNSTEAVLQTVESLLTEKGASERYGRKSEDYLRMARSALRRKAEKVESSKEKAEGRNIGT